jgi:hypothetical protein
MDNESCNACMMVELKALIEKLGSSKTDEETEETQKLAVGLVEACQCPDNATKRARWDELKKRLPKRNG